MSRGAWGGALGGVVVAVLNSAMTGKPFNYAALLGSALIWGWIGHKVWQWISRAR